MRNLWNKFLETASRRTPSLKSLKPENEIVIFKFFKNNDSKKNVDKKTIILVFVILTILISVIIFAIEMNENSIRIDKFHRDIIGRCIDKGWEVSLYKDGQLESCHIPWSLKP